MIETIKQIIYILSVICRQICLLVGITSLLFRIRRNCHKFNVHINSTNLLQLFSKDLSYSRSLLLQITFKPTPGFKGVRSN